MNMRPENERLIAMIPHMMDALETLGFIGNASEAIAVASAMEMDRVILRILDQGDPDFKDWMQSVDDKLLEIGPLRMPTHDEHGACDPGNGGRGVF